MHYYYRNLFIILFLVSILVCNSYECKANLEKQDYIIHDKKTPHTSYHLIIKIYPDTKQIEAKCIVNISEEIDTMVLYLDSNLLVTSIQDEDYKSISFIRCGEQIKITRTFSSKIRNTRKIIISYHGKPEISGKPPWEGGFVWSNDINNKPLIGVVCELDGAKLWWPCTGQWGEKADSVSCTIIVPKNLVAVSNGKLIKAESTSDACTSYSWTSIYPIMQYDVTFYAGHYNLFKDSLLINNDKLALEIYAVQENKQIIKEDFQQVKDILKILSHYFGPYPFSRAAYRLVESPYIGMEHQTAIAFSEPSKDSKSVFELLGYDLKYNLLILHETAHEWWGNSVSASTRNDLWINESMATYTEALFVEYLKGYAESIKYINQDLAFIISNKFPLCDTVNSSKYTTDIYMKGSAFWNTLRSIINDDKKWFSFLLEIQSEYAYKSISTKELITFTNKFFNTNYFYLFNQYIYNYDLPILEIKNYASHVKTVTCRWRNCSDDFIMPLRLGNENIQIIPNTQWQTFSIPSDTVILPEYLTQHYLMNVKFIEEK